MTADDLSNAFATVPPEWLAVLPGWTRDRLMAVQDAVKSVSGERLIGPPDPFRALRLVSPGAVKVVIIGQDPYPTAGHADGLAFSAGRGRPRSLARIFDVLAGDEAGFCPPADWRLDNWARQGVLLLNPVLTVEIGHSGSHLACGWQVLTSEVVRWLSMQATPPVFLLWGGQARAFFQQALHPSSPARAPEDAARPAQDAACLPRHAALGSDPEPSPPVLHTRHPSYDFNRTFMADGSHFVATRHLVDWWAIGKGASTML